MASWMVHIRIAEALLQVRPELDKQFFVIGNIAPDSGVPDENWENFDPPKSITHFTAQDGKTDLLEDLRFFRQYMPENWSIDLASSKNAFLLGYFFHLITDNLWFQFIGKPTQKKHQCKIDSGEISWRDIKSDWYCLDHQYVRENPDSIFWKTFLDAEYDQDYLDFLPPAAINQNMEFIKQNYTNPSNQVLEWIGSSTKKFLNKAQMDAFTAAACRIFKQIMEEELNQEDVLMNLKSIIPILDLGEMRALNPVSKM